MSDRSSSPICHLYTIPENLVKIGAIYSEIIGLIKNTTKGREAASAYYKARWACLGHAWAKANKIKACIIGRICLISSAFNAEQAYKRILTLVDAASQEGM